MSLELRWFAAARQAAGRSSQSVDAGRPLAATLASLTEANRALAGVVARSSYLVDGIRRDLSDPAPLADGSTVDVLPPFAGG